MQDIRYPLSAPLPNGETGEIAEGVLWLRMPLPMALDHVNCFALDDGDGWTLVDTGFDTARTRAIWEEVLAGPLSGKPVTRVIGTHHHPDHIGLAGWFAERGAELVMARTGWLMARMLRLDVQPAYTPESIRFYIRAGMDGDVLNRRRGERPFNYADCVAPMPVGFARLVEGQTLRIGGRTWDVRLGGGHAADHLTFWSRDDALVIGGDQLLPRISANLGVYATEPDADPVGDWLAAIARLAPLAREDQLVLPGHKLPFTGLPRRMAEYRDHTHDALSRLQDWIVTPRRAGDCFDPLYRRSIGSAEYGLALVEAVAHLNHLHRTGHARRWLGEDGAYWFTSA